MPLPDRRLAEALLKHAEQLCEHVWGVDNTNMILRIIKKAEVGLILRQFTMYVEIFHVVLLI
jgi:hypothetical protein